MIDDCSHMYALTKASFEALFPLLRPGAMYVIEDWAWSHWPEFQSASHEWAGEPPLTRLVFDLVEAAGTSRDLIASITIYQGFVAVERGLGTSHDSHGIHLDDHIVRRPQDEAPNAPVTGSPVSTRRSFRDRFRRSAPRAHHVSGPPHEDVLTSIREPKVWRLRKNERVKSLSPRAPTSRGRPDRRFFRARSC